jgi:hypothetical protein
MSRIYAAQHGVDDEAISTDINVIEQRKAEASEVDIAANLNLRWRQNLFDIVPPDQFIDQGAQSEQIVSPKPGMSTGGLRKQIRRRDIGPGCQHRAQAFMRVEVHHAIFAPVQPTTY